MSKFTISGLSLLSPRAASALYECNSDSWLYKSTLFDCQYHYANERNSLRRCRFCLIISKDLFGYTTWVLTTRSKISRKTSNTNAIDTRMAWLTCNTDISVRRQKICLNCSIVWRRRQISSWLWISTCWPKSDIARFRLASPFGIVLIYSVVSLMARNPHLTYLVRVLRNAKAHGTPRVLCGACHQQTICIKDGHLW